MPTFIQRLFMALLRGLVIAAGLIFAAALLVAGLLFTLILLIWSLLRGEKPRIARFRVDPGFGRKPPETRGEVVDIEAREIPEPAPHLTRDER